MTTLGGMMLEVARHVTDVAEGTANSGTTSTLVDTNLTQPIGYWNGGALFLDAGTTDDVVTPVISYSGNTLTVGTLAAAVTSATVYAVANPEFSLNEIKQAVLAVLRQRPVLSIDESLTADPDTLEYTLEEGVSGIRRVIIDGEINFHWKEVEGELVFPSNHAPGEGTITIYYAVPQGDIDYADVINGNYDFNWLKWSAIVNLLRMRMNRVHKDDPSLVEMMNEAKSEEQRARSSARVLMNSDMRLA